MTVTLISYNRVRSFYLYVIHYSAALLSTISITINCKLLSLYSLIQQTHNKDYTISSYTFLWSRILGAYILSLQFFAYA